MIVNNLYAGLFIAAVVLSWLAGAIIVRRWPGGSGLSLSGHGASHKHAYAIFATVLTVTAAITYLFFVRWLIPELHLQWSLRVWAAIFLGFQIITAWVADRPGIERRVHRFTAYSLAVIMPIELLYLVFAPTVSMFARAFTGLVIAGMLCLMYVQVFQKPLRKYFLLYQSAYIVGCQLAIISAVLVRK